MDAIQFFPGKWQTVVILNLDHGEYPSLQEFPACFGDHGLESGCREMYISV